MLPRFVIAAPLAVLAIAPAAAQDAGAAGDEQEDEAPTAEEMIAKANDLYHAPGTRRPCKPAVGNEIVVCATDPSQFRTSSSLDDAIRNGTLPPGKDIPAAPDVDGLPKGGVVVARGCFVPPCPPPPAYYIDFDSLPEPLTPEQAAKVMRAEEEPAEAAP